MVSGLVKGRISTSTGRVGIKYSVRAARGGSDRIGHDLSC